MALEESAMTDLLAALRAGGGLDIVREALALVLQALIDAEATQQIGAGRYERTQTRTAHRNGTRRGCCPPRPVMWSCTSRNCGKAGSSPRCWSHADGSTGPCWRW
jgi:Transposase, Mutator family